MSLRAAILPPVRAWLRPDCWGRALNCRQQELHITSSFIALPGPRISYLGSTPCSSFGAYPCKAVGKRFRALLKLFIKPLLATKVLVVALRTEAFQSPSHKSLLAARQATLVLLTSYSLPKSLLAAGSGSGIAPYFAVGGAVSRIQSARPDAAPVGVGGWR